MSSPHQLQSALAMDVPCASTVIVETASGVVVGLKAEREGKEYVHHYVVPLDPVADDQRGLIYVDPEDTLITCGAVRFELGEASGETDGAGIGNIFENTVGTFLKVIEDPKSQKMFAFVDIASGEVRRRQERGLIAVYANWQATGVTSDGNGTVTLATLHQSYLALK